MDILPQHEAYVKALLRNYRQNDQKIKILEYRKAHMPKESLEEKIEAMNYGHDRETAFSTNGHEDRTSAIALSYPELAERDHRNSDEIICELNRLRDEKECLEMFLSMLDERTALSIRLRFFQALSWKEVADALRVTDRTAGNIVDKGIRKLTAMYAYADNF